MRDAGAGGNSYPSATPGLVQLAHLDHVVRALPVERIAPYLSECGNNSAAALGLYAWNTAASGATYECLSHFEVCLRNSLDAALAGRHEHLKRSGDWLDDRHGELSAFAWDSIADARSNASRGGGSVLRGAIIAELNFGFWRRLLDVRYERYWGSAVMRRFPTLRRPRNNDMKSLRDLVEPLYSLRNRVAHHEPIWKINLANRESDLFRVIEIIDADMARWAKTNSRLGTVLSQRPGP